MDELARLKELLTRNAGEGLTPTALPDVSIQCSRTTTERTGAIPEPTVAVIAQGRKETALNGRTFTYGPGDFVITSLELPVIGHIVQASAREPFLALVLRLSPQRIAELLLEPPPAPPSRRADVNGAPTGIAVSEASPALLDAAGRLLALLDMPSDAAALAGGGGGRRGEAP